MEDFSPTAKIILAAGSSTRMGEPNKLLELIGHQPLIYHTLHHALQAWKSQTVVVLGHQAEVVKRALVSFEGQIEFAYNPDYAQGMTSSIQVGLRQLEPQNHSVCICLGDMPHVNGVQLWDLASEFNLTLMKNHEAIMVPKHDSQKGNPVFFSLAHKGAMLDHTEPNGLRGLVKDLRRHVTYLEMPEAVLQDIDTPEQLAKARTLWNRKPGF